MSRTGRLSVLVVAAAAAATVAGLIASASPTVASAATAAPGAPAPVPLCTAADGGRYHCLAEREPLPVSVPRFAPMTQTAQYSQPGASGWMGYKPTDLRAAYDVPTSAAAPTVAIVDAYDDPSVESDLATYRSYYGLAPCTTANGCFRKVNQNGATTPLPAYDSGWAGEIALDVDMVSAICPSCHILLVESNSNDSSGSPDMETAVKTAVAMGAKYVSMSWGGAEFSGETTADQAYYGGAGVTYVASAGDDGYGTMYPAVSSHVIAVGGTSLMPDGSTPRGWSESVWGGASGQGTGSGCSAYEPRPGWQSAPAITAACANRAQNDVSVVADTATGVSTYQGGGWYISGGTSVGAPIVAAMYALTGETSGSAASAQYAYSHPSNFNDVTSGSNGSCSPALLCTAATGWDGPTGLGTPIGLSALADAPGGVTGTGSAPAPTTSAPTTSAPTTSAPTTAAPIADPTTSPAPPSAGGGGGGGAAPVAPVPTDSPTSTAPTSTAPVTTSEVTLTNPGNQTGRLGSSVAVSVPATDSVAGKAISYTASGLPAGTRLGSGGTITGRLTASGRYSVTVAASDDAGARASVHFAWAVSANRLVPSGALRITGVARRGHTVRLAAISWRKNSRVGQLVHPAVGCQWYLNSHRIRHASRCSYPIGGRASLVGKRLTVRVIARARYYDSYITLSRARAIGL